MEKEFGVEIIELDLEDLEDLEIIYDEDLEDSENENN